MVVKSNIMVASQAAPPSGGDSGSGYKDDAAPCGRHGRAAAAEARPRRGVIAFGALGGDLVAHAHAYRARCRHKALDKARAEALDDKARASAAAERAEGTCTYPPVGRIQRLPLTLPTEPAQAGRTGDAGSALPPLSLELYLAPAPAWSAAGPVVAAAAVSSGDAPGVEPQLVVYVLDTTPALFGILVAYVFAQAGYFADEPAVHDGGPAEAIYRRIHLVGRAPCAPTRRSEGCRG
ncbi:hypothetical protein T492DRAFT_872339 [Pavlovales sp. CCMP2436]|nr:hypothetical protein T492DRAFT_872339 [Pavlovales sp. CCMP2436]